MKSDSEFIMPWGKYTGKSLEDIPSSYLRWLSEECEDDQICEEADKEYEWRTQWKKHWN
jgi:hypothetical protein